MSILLLLAVFAVVLAYGLPVAFAMLVSSGVWLLVDGRFSPSIIVQRVAPALDSFPLLAIPLFILAGSLMNSSGIAHRIFDFAKALIGHVRGGLGHVNIVASLIFAGMSGVASADAAGLGRIELAQMKRAGYDDGFSAAVTAASSIIGPIIPPSVIMVVYAVQASVSLTDMFLAGLVPGLLLGGFLIVAVYVLARFGLVTAPTSPRATKSEVWSRLVAALPALCAPVFLLLGLFFGIATPTELGALLVIYAIALGLIQGDLKWPEILAALTSTARACGVLVLIIAAAVPLGWIIAVDGVSGTMAAFLVSVTDSPAQMLLMVAVILLVAGMFIETAALLLIAVPIFLPTALQFGVDPVHFGIVLILTVLIGAVTPPFGLILFVTMNISGISFGRMCRSILPFYVPMLLLLILIILVPELSLSLPEAMGAK